MPRKPNPKIDTEAPASRIASLWGTASSFARAIDRPRSTVQDWLESGHVPGDEHKAIVEAAKRDGVKLKPAHFVDHRLFKAAANA